MHSTLLFFFMREPGSPTKCDKKSWRDQFQVDMICGYFRAKTRYSTVAKTKPRITGFGWSGNSPAARQCLHLPAAVARAWRAAVSVLVQCGSCFGSRGGPCSERNTTCRGCVQPLDEGRDTMKLPHFRIHNDVAHSIDHGHSLFSDALERPSCASGTRSFVQPSIPTMTAMAQESPSPKAMREQQIQDVKKRKEGGART